MFTAHKLSFHAGLIKYVKQYGLHYSITAKQLPNDGAC
jgi:hypothetical protein